MISKILLFNSEYEAAKGLEKLEQSGISKQQLRVLVANVEHSRLLNSETDIHIDLLSEIADANHSDIRHTDVIGESPTIPYFVSQTAVQFPVSGIGGIELESSRQQMGITSLINYGLSERNAEECLYALRAGQCIVCISEDTSYTSFEARPNPSVFSGLNAAFNGYSTSNVQQGIHFNSVGAAEIWDN